MHLAVTGHRPPKIGGYYQPNRISSTIQQAMREALLNIQPDMVYIGMALGTDQMMAEVCVQTGVPFYACIPFLGFESRWPPQAQERYRRLLELAARSIVVTPVQQYRAWYMQARNQWMVDHADQLLAVWNGVRDGGTWNCIRYAEVVSKPWTRLTLPPALWEEARRLEAGTTSSLAALPLESNTTPRPEIPIVPEQPPQIGSFALRLIRRRGQGPNPPPGISPLTDEALQHRDLFHEAQEDLVHEIARAIGVPASLLEGVPQEENPPSPGKKEEVRDRFKPGRVLELDDD